MRHNGEWDEVTDRLVKARTLGALGRQNPSDLAPLNAAVRMLDEALRLASPDYPHFDVLLENASFQLLERYDRGGGEDDLAPALLLCRRAVNHTPDDEPELMARRLITLGNALRRERQSTARPRSDEESEVFALAAVSARPTSPYKNHAVTGLLRSLKEAEPSQDGAALAVALLRRVRTAHPDDGRVDDHLARWLHAAAEWLMRGYEQGLPSGVTGLREAAGTLGEAARLAGHDTPLGGEYLLDQSVVLQTVHRDTRETHVLDAAIAACRKAADATHISPPHRASATARLGEQLLGRYLVTGDSGDLTESVARLDKALASPHLPEKTRHWGALVSVEAHDYQARRRAAPVTQRETVVPLELVVLSAPDDETRLVPYAPATGRAGARRRGPVVRLVSVAAEELRRSVLRADAADARSAMAAAREAVLATPAGDPGLPPLVVMYADACRLHITLSGEFGELNVVAGLYRWAARTLAKDDPQASDTRAKAAGVVTAYTALAGFADPRDGTIGALRCAADRASAGDPERGVLLWRLANGLHERYREVGDFADLDESIEFTKRASYALTGKDAASCLLDLADRLRHRHGITKDTDDWLDATLAARDATTADPEFELTVEETTGVDRHLMRGGQPDEPESTMRRYREALHRARPGDSQALADLTRFRRFLMGRMAQRGADGGPPETRAELDEAVAVHRRLDELTPHHFLHGRTINGHGLALMLHHRYKRFGDPRDKDEAIATAQRAAALGGLPELTIRAAQAAAMWAADDEQWQRAAECFRQAVALLPVLSPRQAGRESQERRLKTMFGLASNGAAAALWCGDADAGLEILEQGRGLLRGYATEGRRDFPELAAAGPEGERLARALRSVADELAAAVAEDSGRGGGSAREVGSDRRHGLAQRWDGLVRAAREFPGLEDFQRPARVADLLPGPGATVVLNASPYRCDALLIRSGQLDVVPLPDLSTDALNKHVGRFIDVLAFAHLNPYDTEAQRLGQRPLREVLAWLWEVVAAPVLDRLGMSHAPASGEPWPRIWWVPTGMLTFLPLHAAGLPDGPAVLDRAVSSYATSVRELRDVQAMTAERDLPSTTEGRLLAVASAHVDGREPLVRVAEEVAAITRHFPRHTALSANEATCERVLGELTEADWAHFACHAVSNPHRPSESRLLLADKPMDIAALTGLRLSGGRLAYLSACEAARGGLDLADEGITLASTFRLAGYEHAIAALWAVLDSTAAQTAELFYQAAAAGSDPATALHLAQREMRNRTPDLPSRWAPYLHAGP